jgi:hypothetical protein
MLTAGVLLPVLICAAVLVGLALVLHNLTRAESALPVTAEWINELSTERYRPMMRLLDVADIEFLRNQPGYTRAIETRLRAQRCQIFRGYLRCLNLDFKRVATALKIFLTQSEHDRPDLAAMLVQHQIRFATATIAVHFQLLLFQYGIGRVDAGALLKLFDLVRVELGSLVPAESQVCA